ERIDAAAVELPTSGLRVRHGGGLAGRLVAVVDNEARVAASLGRLLAGWDAVPVIAADGEELLQRLAGRRPDIAIIDRHLEGGEDGFALAARLEAAVGGALPVLILTGDYDIGNLALANRDRRRILQKPAMPAVLHAVLLAELGGQDPVD
ncbi:MAG: response regulator, partial [Rhizobiales bacterium]|nr:response regulator [Hyphomicrobiales bacterium]